MKDYYTEYLKQFRKYKSKQKDFAFFKDEINSVINSIFDEIQYSKKFIRYNQKGIEIDYFKDVEKFKKDIKHFSNAFVGENISIRYPQRVSYIFATSYNYLTHLGIEEEDIKDVFEFIREDIFNLETSPSLGRAQNELSEAYEKMIISTTEMSKKWEILTKSNPNLKLKELIKKFTS